VTSSCIMQPARHHARTEGSFGCTGRKHHLLGHVLHDVFLMRCWLNAASVSIYLSHAPTRALFRSIILTRMWEGRTHVHERTVSHGSNVPLSTTLCWVCACLLHIHCRYRQYPASATVRKDCSELAETHHGLKLLLRDARHGLARLRLPCPAPVWPVRSAAQAQTQTMFLLVVQEALEFMWYSSYSDDS
jgi:hypothetical protein